MWGTIIAIGLFLLLIFWLVYSKATGRWEYKRFLRELDRGDVHLATKWAREDRTWDADKPRFLRGVVFFNHQSFHFLNERAFQRAIKELNIPIRPFSS